MAHIHKLIDFVTNVLIVNKDRVLLVDHKKLKLWLPIGGHIELNEDTDQALIREIKEECGLKVEILSKKSLPDKKHIKFLYLPSFLDIHQINDEHRHIALGYIAKSKTDKIKLRKSEHNNIRWFSKKDLDNPQFEIKKEIKYYCLEALKVAKQNND
ncbi:MAG: NUDIX domain-containing protein [Patescibacteria group bacterium]